MAPFRVWPGWDAPAARWMLRFGVPLALTSLVEYIVLNLDYVVVGRVLGPVALGLYLLAYNVSNWPVSIVTDAVRRVSIAGFAHVSADDEAVRAGFHRTFRILAIVSLPLVLLLAVLAARRHRGALRAQVERVGHRPHLPRHPRRHPRRDRLRVRPLIGVGRSRLTLVLKLAWLVALLPALVIGARDGRHRGGRHRARDRGPRRGVTAVHARCAGGRRPARPAGSRPGAAAAGGGGGRRARHPAAAGRARLLVGALRDLPGDDRGLRLHRTPVA